VIADALGVSRDDLPKFKHWSDCSVAQFSLVTTPDQDIYIAQQIVEFQHYFAARIEERRVNPSDDVVSALVHARIDGEGPLDVPEMLSIIQQILVAFLILRISTKQLLHQHTNSILHHLL
jgi:cytochrome P450